MLETSVNALPPVRRGITRRCRVSTVTLYITINRDSSGNICEIFGKADEGYNAEVDGLCILASIAIRHGASPLLIAKHLRHRKYTPRGIAGQPCSISDAIGKALEDEYNN